MRAPVGGVANAELSPSDRHRRAVTVHGTIAPAGAVTRNETLTVVVASVDLPVDGRPHPRRVSSQSDVEEVLSQARDEPRGKTGHLGEGGTVVRTAVDVAMDVSIRAADAPAIRGP